MYVEAMMVLGISVLAYWRQDFWLYLIAGASATYFGFQLVESYLWIGILTVAFGVYSLIRAFIPIIKVWFRG